MDEACRLHLEGIVSKRRNSVYRPGRGLDWVKVKCSQRAEFVIGGFTRPGGSRSHFGALLLGYYDRGKKLIYAGRVGTGFTEETLDALHKKLTKLVQTRSPFANLAGTTGAARDVFWVKPELVGEIEFSNWTDDRLLRHPSFQGLREDKPASKVVHDEPLPVREVTAMENGHNGAPTRRSRSPGRRHRPATGRRTEQGEWPGRRRMGGRTSVASRQGLVPGPQVNEARSGRLLHQGRGLDAAARRRTPVGDRSLSIREREAMLLSKASRRRGFRACTPCQRLGERSTRISPRHRRPRGSDFARTDGRSGDPRLGLAPGSSKSPTA